MAATIYDSEATIELGKFIKNATCKSRYLIPDLQRPYVWTPSQVILLVDSIFKGWPFGSLLTWQVIPVSEKRGSDGEDAVIEHKIPFRPFYTKISRVAGVDSECASVRDVPHNSDGDEMILDGQQRLQSLILALGDTNGIVLYDADWHSYKGRKTRRNLRNYTTAFLYLNVKAFVEEMQHHNGSCQNINLEKALDWVAVNSSSHIGSGNCPLEILEQSQGVFVRLSDLWDLVDPSHDDLDNDIKPNVEDLCDEKFDADKLASLGVDKKCLVDWLASFVRRLIDVYILKIRCLRVVNFEPSRKAQKDKVVFESEKLAYDDAIVNIFTRLNTAGRTLTREEITYSWLKQGWNKTAEFDSAIKFVGSVKEAFAEHNIYQELKDDDVISAMSFFWGVIKKDGSLLKDSDLLRSDNIRPMAKTLSANASDFVCAARRVASLMQDNELILSSSFNTTVVGLTFYAIAFIWICKTIPARPVMERDNAIKALDETFLRFMYRWQFIPVLAGSWTQRTNVFLEGIAKIVYEYYSKVDGLKDHEVFKKEWRECSARINEKSKDQALALLRSTVDNRNKVSVYRSRLIVWQRLNESRSGYRVLTFINATSKQPSLQVDHVIAHAKWEEFVKGQIAAGKLTKQKCDELFGRDDSVCTSEDVKAKAIAFINSIGNCSILNSTYNNSKDKRELGDFIGQMHEFLPGDSGLPKVDVQEWCKAMLLSDVFLHPFSKQYTMEDIVKAVKERESSIYAELEKFIENKPGYDKLY